MKPNLRIHLFDLLYSLMGALVLGSATAFFCKGSFWSSWLAAVVISLVVVFLLLKVWRGFDTGRALGTIMLVAFILRVAFGILSYSTLPLWGYDTSTQNSGFLYSDAEGRDIDAYDLASSKNPLTMAFTDRKITDQYGGMMFLSALVYRTLSPDVSRPLLITLLAAFVMTVGAAYLYAAIRMRWTKKTAIMAAWILALYPDSILVGSSQMREPFLMGLACIAFWAVLQWREKPFTALIVPIVTMAIACSLSVPSGMVLAAILIAVFLLDWSIKQQIKRRSIVGFIVLSLLGCAAIAGGWIWLRPTLYFDTFTTISSSGWITSLIEKFGEQWKLPFVTIYGFTQPLLPAAIFEPSVPFWVTIAIIRGLAWYAALPLLLFGVFEAWRMKEQNSWLIRLLYIIFFIWVVVSSMRAGGDLWDNPRYRFTLLPFLALILSWTIEHYQLTKSRWLWRWTAVISVFLIFFTNFYAYRYTGTLGVYIQFVPMVAMVAGLCVLIPVGGLIADRFGKKKPQE